MTKIVRYDNPHDVHMRLNNCILKYLGDPYYVEAAGMELLLYAHVGGQYKMLKRVDANSEDVDISSVPLGYCNIPGRQPVYLQREAARRQKQGVSLQSIKAFCEGHRQWYHPASKVMNDMSLVFRVVKGEYPTLEQVVNEPDYQQGGAINRRVCLLPVTPSGGDKYKIKFITDFCGIYSKKKNTAMMTSMHVGNSFLRHSLELKGVTIHDF